MKNIKSLLERIVSTLNRDELVKNNFIEIIFEESGVRLMVQDLEYKDGVLFIKTSQVAKSQIALKESSIRARMNSVLRITYR